MDPLDLFVQGQGQPNEWFCQQNDQASSSQLSVLADAWAALPSKSANKLVLVPHCSCEQR